MNKFQESDLRRALRSPYTAIGAVIITGLLINAYLALALVLPVFQADRALNLQIQTLNEQQLSLENQPIPTQVTVYEMEALLRQVPVKEDLARLLVGFRNIELQSGARIESFKPDGEVVAADSQRLASPGNPSGEAQAVSPGGQVTRTSVFHGVKETSLIIEISGTYGQTMDFMNRLYLMERLTQIRQWTLHTVNSSMNGANQAGTGAIEVPSSENVTAGDTVMITMKLSVYTFPGYADHLNELPPLEVPDVGQRLDPTWSEEQFRALLKRNP